jgi:hypothetical protein
VLVDDFALIICSDIFFLVLGAALMRWWMNQARHNSYVPNLTELHPRAERRPGPSVFKLFLAFLLAQLDRAAAFLHRHHPRRRPPPQ